MADKEQTKTAAKNSAGDLAEELDVAIEAGLKLREQQEAEGLTTVNIYMC